jgi:hypothetical protein
VTLRLNEWVERDILTVFAAVHESEFDRLGIAVCGVIEVVERIRLVLRNVVVIPTYVREDGGNDVSEGGGDRGAIDFEEEFVEDGGGSAHYVAGLVKAADALLALGDSPGGEARSKVSRGRKCMWLDPRSHFKGVEFVDSRI